MDVIAAECGLSRRTIMRDVRLLRDRGVPVDADRGRGGGVRIGSTWGIGRLALSYREAVDLLVSLAIVEQLRSPILMANLASIRRKLAASFGPDARGRIARMKSRILVGDSASTFVLTGYSGPKDAVVEKLHQAFLTTRTATILYRSGTGSATSRQVQPHYLLLNYPVWYALCWDELRGDVRTFRCDRMLDITMSDSTFAVLPATAFKQALEGVSIISH
jgi:predicted DNA-binding transcriptional regulator YafY